MSLSRSTPITSTWPALPPRTMSAASEMPWQKPAQAAEMSNAAAWSVPSSWAIAVATAGRLQQVGDGGDDDAVDLAGGDAGALERLPRGGDRHHLHGLLGRGPAALLDAGALLDPLVAGVDRLDHLGVGDDPGRAVGAEAEDARRAALRWRRRAGGHQDAPSGCSRSSGWPGETEVAVLDEPLDDLAAVRAPRRWRGRARLATSPIGGAGGEHVAAGRLRRTGGRCPWRGRPPSARSAWCRSAEASPCFCDEGAGVVELVGGLEREGLDALEGALGDAGEGAGGRHLEDAGHAEVRHGLQAEVPADRAGDLADDPGEHVLAVVDDLAVLVGDQRGARVVDRHRAGEAGRGGRRRGPCGRCGTRRRR